MKRHDPTTDRKALAISYKVRADAIKAGRVIVSNPEQCIQKRAELMRLHDLYMDKHFYNNVGE